MTSRSGIARLHYTKKETVLSCILLLMEEGLHPNAFPKTLVIRELRWCQITSIHCCSFPVSHNAKRGGCGFLPRKAWLQETSQLEFAIVTTLLKLHSQEEKGWIYNGKVIFFPFYLCQNYSGFFGFPLRLRGNGDDRGSSCFCFLLFNVITQLY